MLKTKNMKIRNLLLITMALVLLFSMVFAETGDKTKAAEKANKKNEINWLPLDTALALAKEQNKHVFIDFTTTWCGYCKKMERDVFSKDEIINLLNDNFVAAKVDGDSKNELEIQGYKITEQSVARNEFQVKGYPTFWWLTPEGTKLTSVSGYRDINFMKEALTYIKDYKYDTTQTTNPEQPQPDGQ